MTRRNPSAKWTLPLNVHPETHTDWCVPVPDDPFYRAGFLGALQELGAAYKWADDLDHTAREVARVWREIIDALQNCSTTIGDNMQFRQNGCLLEYSIDCVHWNTLYDPSECISERGTQHPPAGSLDPDGCHEFDVALAGNGYWLLPVPVNADTTIEITQCQGGWADGSIAPVLGLTHWYCPNGQDYALGQCADTPAVLAGDPATTVPHMRLIALIDGIYYDAFDTLIAVPSGTTGDVGVQFQANDAALGDNAGSISFHVRVCGAGVSTWTHEFDFASGQQGWYVGSNQGSFATDHFECNQTFQVDNNSGTLRVYYDLPSVAHITGVEWDYSVNDTEGAADIRASDTSPWSGGGHVITDYDDGAAIHTTLVHSQPSIDGDSIGVLSLLFASTSLANPPVCNLYRVTLHGIGPEPAW